MAARSFAICIALPSSLFNISVYSFEYSFNYGLTLWNLIMVNVK